MNFDTWYDLYSYPYESREDAAERFADEQGYENPAEKQGFLDSLPEYDTFDLQEERQRYSEDLLGDWTPPEPAPITTPPDYEDDPDVLDSLYRGVDLAQASAFGVGEGAGAGFLEDIGLSDASKSLKDWSREGRLRNEAEAATVAPAKSIKEEVAANPDSWYKYLDEDMMTWGQMAEAAPTSLAPFAAALPLALATPYVAAAAGIAATGTLGSTLLSAGVAMGVGNVASSAFVSSEAYERGKNERIIREQLGVDPDKKFEDLLPSDQQKVDRVATDLSQTSFGHRLYTAGLVEMASYIPYGHAMVRLALDTGLGTASEVWDRTLYSEDAVDALIENGVPAEKAEELREAIIQAGPGLRETLIAAVQQEFVMGGAATGIESLVGKTAPQVNPLATSTQEMKKEIKNASELFDERKQKQIELDSKAQADREKQELRERIQKDQQDRKFYDATLLEELKQAGKEKTPKELALEKEQQELDKMVPAVIEEDTSITYEGVQELEGQQKSLEDSLVEQVSEPYKSIAEEKAKRKRFDANLPISVADLNKQKKIIEEEQTKYKEGSDLKRGAQERLKAIDAKIKELTPQLRTAEEIRTEKIKNREREASIKKERVVLANIEKKLYGAKGEKGADRTFWKQEKFVEERFYKKRKLALQQQEEIAQLTEGEYQSETGEQIQRRRRIQEEETKKLAEDIVDQTIKPSTLQSDGGFGFDLDFIRKYVEDLGKRHEKYKGIYTVLSTGSPQDLATILLRNKHKNPDGSRMNREQATTEAEKLMAENNAFVYGDHVYVIAENIKGADKKAAMENLVKIVTFHEPITHLGLKQFLGSDYIPFLDNFFNTNKKDIQNWAENEAVTEQGNPAYLGDTEFSNLTESQQRDLAEEFLANKFVELGIADPDILTRTADSLLSVLKGIVDPQNKRISTVQARSVLAEVQRSYLGGKKNIITGSLFDPANWTMKGFEVAAGEDKVESYRKYLKKQKIDTAALDRGEPTKTIKSEDMASLKKPLEIEKTRKKSAVAAKKGTAELLKERSKKKPRGITGDLPDVIYASKRIMTPAQAEVWKLNNKGKGKGRKPRNPILVALAKKLETGKASYEEYRDKANKLLPIKKFQSVPEPASDSVILGSIDKGQYKKGLLLGEDTLRSGKDIVNVRLDIPAYERFDSWVATITHAGDTIYGAAVRLKNVTFKAPPRGALRIAQGEEKTTLATMKGTWQGDSIADIEQMANDYLDNPAWVQIGYNPERQSSFYLRENKTINGQEFEKGTPLSSAEEVIQVGAFVLAKNVTTKATPSLTIGDVTLKYSKQQAINEKTKTTKEGTTKSRKATEQFDTTPIPLAWLRDLGDVSALKKFTDNIAERFGSNGNKVSIQSLKVYNLDPLIGTEEKPNTKIDKLLKEKGFEYRLFSFEPSRFKLPNFKKDSYHNGVVWIYDPTVDEASFHDADYTKAWRVTHELGHALTEKFMYDKYGASVREGRLGVKSVNYRGVPPKRAKVEIPAITLQEAQRAVEWEDVAFRAQRKVLEELGVKVSESDFAREYNINIKGALHRILTADFDDPITDGFRPNAKNITDLRGILELLETTENQIAKAQGRESTKGIDLKTWEPITDSAIVEAVNNPVVARKPKTRKGIKALSDPSINTFKFSRSLTDEKTKTAEEAVKGKTKGSDETRDSISGTTAKSPYEGRLDVESDGESHFVHWSKSPDLIETDPSYYGTGIAGKEGQKKKQYPDIFVPRTYIGLPNYRKEEGLGKNMYETNLDPTTLYDIESIDRLDLWEQAVDEMGLDKGAYSTRFEGLLKEAGYAGYFNKTHNVAVLFNPTKVNFTQEKIGPSTYVPSIRGDQSIKYSKAFHGSGARFPKFSTGKVGTGEGALAHGWGLYFSGKKDVGEWYKKTVTAKKNIKMPEKDIKDYWKKGNIIDVDLNKTAFVQVKDLVSELAEQHGLTIKEYTATKLGVNQGMHVEEPRIKVLGMKKVTVTKEGMFEGWSNVEEVDHVIVQEVMTKDGYVSGGIKDKKRYLKGKMLNEPFSIKPYTPHYESFKKVTGRDIANMGALYDVTLAPKDHEYLMLDKDITAQSETVKNVAKEKYSWLLEKGRKWEYFGRTFYDELTKEYGSKKAASQYLLSKGVRGNKYYTGATRKKAGAKDYNYVIFDDTDVTIDAMYSKRLASQGSYEQYVSHQQEGIKPVGRPDTPEWNKFMEGSKIKYPLYHGTRSGVDYFDYFKLKEGDYHTGLHLSNEPEYANMYAEPEAHDITIGATGVEADLTERLEGGEAPNVIKGFVNVKNPLKLEGKGDVGKWKQGIRSLRAVYQVMDAHAKSKHDKYENHFLAVDDKERQSIIELLHPDTFFSKQERNARVKYLAEPYLNVDDGINRNFYKYIKDGLAWHLDGGQLDMALDVIISRGMGHDALLYVQEIGDWAPKPFVGVMMINPEIAQTGRSGQVMPVFETPEGLPSFPFRSAFNQKPNDPSDFKFSKRIKDFSPKELVAEWKTNVKAAVKGDEEDTIVIGGKKGDKKTISSVARAMSKIMGLGKKSKMFGREIIIGKTGVEIQPSMDGQSLAWSSMRAFEKGKGEGTKTMNKILKIAKEEQVNIIASAKAFGEGGPATPQLEKWYRKLGFEEHTRGRIIFRGKPEVLVLTGKFKAIDISPKAILDPDGNIKTSKILASRAAMFALRSGGVNTKGMPWRYRLAEKLTRSITPQGSLPDRLKYLAIRRLIKGKIKGAEDASKALYNILKNTKQADVIYKYFTTRDFDANKITNKAEREAAIGAKARIDEIGEQLVKSDLLDEGAREQYKGMYLPQVYLKYLLKEGDNPFVKVRGGGGVQIDQNYLKKRLSEQELPKEIRELILGEIKDPAYLASKAISIPAKDMAILDWLQQIAGNEDWVAKDSLVSFDTFAEIRKAKLPLEAQKALELKDTKGVRVSGHWLKNESERIWSMTKYMNLDKTNTKIVEDLVKAMEEVSDKAFKTPYDPKLYAIVPKTKKYGMLAGMALRKEIANDIFGGMNMQTGDMSIAEGILGDGGTLGNFNRFWKWSKVSANPPSWVRNFVSNMILMNMGGVPFWKMPSLITSSLRDMQGKGKYKGQLHQLARDLGLTAGNFSNIELGRIEREFKDLQIRMKNKGGPMGVIGMMKGAFNKVQDVTSDTYGGIDTLGKMMVLKHDLDKNKIKIKDLAEYKGAEKETLNDIAYNAEKWLFDYSNVLPSVKYLRNVPFGAPFASFTSFVAPLMLETAITKPWKFLPYYALGYAMKEMFKDNFELDDDQYEGLKVSMSDYLREKAYGSIFPTAVIPFPYLDDNKRIQFMDVSYLYPWGMFSEMAGEITEGKVGDAVKTAGLLGSPGLNIASAIMTGIDPFTRKQIVDETGTNSEKAADLIWYAWNLSAPPMLHGIWQGPGEGYGAVKRLKDAFTGALNKDGEAKFTEGQAVGRMFGMNITPIAVPEGRNKHLRWEYSKHNKLVYRAKRELTNMLMMQMDMAEIKKEGKEWGKKILKSQEEFRKKIKISAPPVTLLREREKFLREQKQLAQQYRASL